MAPGMMMEGWDAVGLSTGPALGLGTNLGQYIEDLALCERHGDAEKLLWSPASSSHSHNRAQHVRHSPKKSVHVLLPVLSIPKTSLSQMYHSPSILACPASEMLEEEADFSVELKDHERPSNCVLWEGESGYGKNRQKPGMLSLVSRQMLEFLWSWGQQLDHYISQITKIWQEGPHASPHWRPLRLWGIWTPPLQQNRCEEHAAVLVLQERLVSHLFSCAYWDRGIISRSGLVLLCKKPWKFGGWGGEFLWDTAERR